MRSLGAFVPDDHFKIDVECHMAPKNSGGFARYLFGYKSQNRRYGITRNLGMEDLDLPPTAPLTERDASAEATLAIMDKYGIDMACATREDLRRLTGGVAPITTNQYLIEVCSAYPERFILQACPHPLRGRDMNHVIWELEFLVREANCKLVGEFSPMEGIAINDRELWPFYSKLSDLGVPISIHTGMNWLGGGNSNLCHPQLLEDVVEQFPDLKVIALHCGWPYHRDLYLIASSHTNVYISISLIVPWCITAPRRAAELLGEALQFVGADRIVWGTDSFGVESRVRLSVQGLSEFSIPDGLQEDYGFPPLTDSDKEKIFGLNLAQLLGIEVRRRVPGSDVES